MVYFGGAGGIRTLDRALQPYNGLANRRLQPLGHSSGKADMPDAGASRKRQIAVRRIPCNLEGLWGDHATKSPDGKTPVRTADRRWAGREIHCRDQDLNGTGRQPVFILYGGRLARRARAAVPRPEPALSLVGWMISVGTDDSLEHSIRRKPFAVRNGNPAFGAPAPRCARQIELFENRLMKQRFVIKSRSQLSVNCATPIQKRRPSQGPKRFLYCVCRGVR